jgi:hypothetical protein
MTGKTLAVVAAVIIVLVAAGAFVYLQTPASTTASTSEFDDMDDLIDELDSYLESENSISDYDMDDFYSGWG